MLQKIRMVHFPLLTPSEECLHNSDYATPSRMTLKKWLKIPFMKKALSQAIMQRTKLGNKLLKNSTEHNKVLYFKQRNWCIYRLKNGKKKDFF